MSSQNGLSASFWIKENISVSRGGGEGYVESLLVVEIYQPFKFYDYGVCPQLLFPAKPLIVRHSIKRRPTSTKPNPSFFTAELIAENWAKQHWPHTP